MTTTQDNIDAAVEATGGGDNRETVTVLAWRHNDGDPIQMEVVGTDDRTMWAVASSESVADDHGMEQLYERRNDAYTAAHDWNLGIREGYRVGSPKRVYERVVWSELDESTHHLDEYRTTEVTVPRMIWGIPSDWTEMVTDMARERFIEEGTFDESDFN
jgi:hypothetical protein